jgi:hypothetical protein
MVWPHQLRMRCDSTGFSGIEPRGAFMATIQQPHPDPAEPTFATADDYFLAEVHSPGTRRWFPTNKVFAGVGKLPSATPIRWS